MLLNKIKTLTGAIAIAVLTTTSVNAQLKTPAPSPSQTLKQAFALSDITIDYSRPSAKGRVVYGDVVPFGTVWRTGANSSTKITFGEDVKVEGAELKAGTYALYSIPNKDSWDLMFYKDLTLGGDVSNYKAENEVLKIKGSFNLMISNCNEPSKTMRISPIVPKIGKIGFKFGTEIFRLSVISFAQKPKSKSNITDGILVLEAVMSNT